jgi:hypothetical protein
VIVFSRITGLGVDQPDQLIKESLSFIGIARSAL